LGHLLGNLSISADVENLKEISSHEQLNVTAGTAYNNYPTVKRNIRNNIDVMLYNDQTAIQGNASVQNLSDDPGIDSVVFLPGTEDSLMRNKKKSRHFSSNKKEHNQHVNSKQEDMNALTVL
jgi:hypothetical protein